MSILDRFLASESVLNSFPNINAISLDRFLSDHRPILLKDNRYDYGPTPFRFFHNWLEMAGFQKELGKLDSVIDCGQGNDEMVKKRLDIIHQREVTNAEIKNAIWECGMDKAPGPDGFSFGFLGISGTLWRWIYTLRGLKQGDPLSPFLFLLVMESLHISFQRVVEANIFKGEWSENNISTLIHVLDCFHRVFGLKINLHKSKLMGIEVDPTKVTREA
nr:RNA-directed DNA polymerase, eukaryota, reverse transcriptase zinc-binding domain protein [Tanacetum cinerariifolium]